MYCTVQCTRQYTEVCVISFKICYVLYVYQLGHCFVHWILPNHSNWTRRKRFWKQIYRSVRNSTQQTFALMRALLPETTALQIIMHKHLWHENLTQSIQSKSLELQQMLIQKSSEQYQTSTQSLKQTLIQKSSEQANLTQTLRQKCSGTSDLNTITPANFDTEEFWTSELNTMSLQQTLIQKSSEQANLAKSIQTELKLLKEVVVLIYSIYWHVLLYCT